MRRFASLRRRAEFARLRQRGRRLATPHFTVFAAPAYRSDERAVVGMTVAKTVGKAVDRNRLRRRMAAILHDALTGRRFRLLLIARPGAAEVAFSSLRAEIAAAVERSAAQIAA
jgi:ribonuclease P protein component